MMRKYLLSILIFIPLLLAAQEQRPRNLPAYDLKRLRFGFTVGLNMMDLGITRNYDADNFVFADTDPALPEDLGFQVNVISSLRLNENWNLRFLPGINLNSRKIAFYEYTKGADQPIGSLVEEEGITNPAILGAAYLDFPLLLQYRSFRMNNSRPYLIGGLSFRYDLAGKKPGHFRQDKNSGDFNPIRLQRGDLFFEIGFGWDNYLTYFKFAPEVKVAIGLFNIMDQYGNSTAPNYANSVSAVRTYMVMLNFHFE